MDCHRQHPIGPVRSHCSRRWLLGRPVVATATGDINNLYRTRFEVLSPYCSVTSSLSPGLSSRGL